MMFDDLEEFFDSFEIDENELENALNENNTTYEQALKETENFRNNFFDTVKKNNIKDDNCFSICFDITSNIYDGNINDDLIYLYFAVITDKGLLFDLKPEERSEEQNILCFLEQKNNIQKLMDKIQMKKIYEDRIQEISKLKIKEYTENIQDEQADIYFISMQYEFLNYNQNNNVFLDNIGGLVQQVNSAEMLKSLKPYIYSAVLSRKHKMMLERKNYSVNIKSVFKYNEYTINNDNGKNFDTYANYLELYDHLRRFFENDKDVDLEFSDYCFANLSNLSDWYYKNCEVNENIPKTLKYEISEYLKNDITLVDYSKYKISDFMLKNKAVSIVYSNTLSEDKNLYLDFISAMYNNKSIKEYAKRLYESSDVERKCRKSDLSKVLTFAEIFLFNHVEILLTERFVETADLL